MTDNSPSPNGASAGPVFTGIQIGVIGIAAFRTGPFIDGVTRSSWSAMEDYAALIEDRAPIRVLRLPMSGGDAHTVASRITDLASRVSGVFVLGLGPTESATVQRSVADHGGPPVITELDVVTAALAAAAVTTLRKRGVAPRRGRVVIAGPEFAPDLGPALVGSGVAIITSWHERDAQAYPLRRLMEHNDVLLDLRATASHPAAPGRTLLYPAEPFDYGALVLPGLLSAVCGHGVANLTVDMLAAAARAVALMTPTERVLPPLSERLLVQAVARHVAQVLGEQARDSP